MQIFIDIFPVSVVPLHVVSDGSQPCSCSCFLSPGIISHWTVPCSPKIDSGDCEEEDSGCNKNGDKGAFHDQTKLHCWGRGQHCPCQRPLQTFQALGQVSLTIFSHRSESFISDFFHSGLFFQGKLQVCGDKRWKNRDGCFASAAGHWRQPGINPLDYFTGLLVLQQVIPSTQT